MHYRLHRQTIECPSTYFTLEQRRNLVWNNVTTLFQLHFDVISTSGARWGVPNTEAVGTISLMFFGTICLGFHLQHLRQTRLQQFKPSQRGTCIQMTMNKSATFDIISRNCGLSCIDGSKD